MRATQPSTPNSRATTHRRLHALAAALSRLRLPLFCRAQLHLPFPLLPRVPIKDHPIPYLHAHPSSHGCHCRRRAPPRRTRPSSPPPPELAPEPAPLEPLKWPSPVHPASSDHYRSPPPVAREQVCRGQPSSSHPSPNQAHQQVSLDILVLPHPFPLTTGEPPRRISAKKHLAPPRDYIAITKFF
jgi:hypothetical protein